ncbi:MULTISPECIES: hypothetical protein [Paracoccus]|uniref:hypothetical protein n=1 Tax=Paracoccus TaxID=265 RepID=UPI000785F9BA|nr:MULTISPECIES: hypothetical protein [Paracoccus]MCV2446601.1 hypothetical protein [Paracoccus sp. DMF]
MCCATRPQPRKATPRPAHLCRGRGGRGCRCHAGARRRLARPVLAGNGHPLRWRPAPEDPPPVMRVLHDPPQRPQAPPCPV